MKKYLMVIWYLVGVLCSLPALLFLVVSHWLGITAKVHLQTPK